MSCVNGTNGVEGQGSARPRSWGQALGKALAMASATLLLVPGLAHAACKLQTFELPVTMTGMRAIVKLGINGQQVPFILDSGAFRSTLSAGAAEQLNLEVHSLPNAYDFEVHGVTGKMDAGLTTVKRLQLGSGEIPDVEFIVGGNTDSGGMGYLGRNILAVTDIEYDLAHRVVRLVFPNDECDKTMMAYWAGDKTVGELALLDDHGSQRPAIRATAQLNGVPLDVLFDTGAVSTVTLGAARHAGITDMKPDGKVYGAGRGSANAWTAKADRFELGGEAISNIRMAISDFDLREDDMLLGIDFFLSHRIYISKKQRRMYFTYNGGPVFANSAREIASAAAAASAAQAVGADEALDAAEHARRAEMLIEREDFGHALADLDRACKQAPQTADYFALRGTVHMKMGHAAQALKDFDTALQLEPALQEARLERAEVRASSGNRDGSLEDLRVLDKSMTPYADARLRMARLYQQLDQLDLALPQWALWTTAHSASERLGRVLNERCWARVTHNIELDRALADCNKAIDLDGRKSSYYGTRAWLRLRQGEMSKAMSDFEDSLDMQADNAWSLYGRGRVRLTIRREAKAGQADIEAARKLLPSIYERAARYGLAASTTTPSTPGSEPAGR